MPKVLEFKIPFVENVSGLKVNLLTLLYEKENQLRETIYSNRTLIVILYFCILAGKHCKKRQNKSFLLFILSIMWDGIYFPH